MRFFNTEGPNRPENHYTLPPLSRWDLDEILALIDQKKYFLLHAPRQTGKTTCLLALAEHLNREGRYRAVYANLEVAQAYRAQLDKGMTAVVEQISRGARDQLGDAGAAELGREIILSSSGGTAVGEFLARWSAQSLQPLVLLLDEVDALIGDTLLSLLRQLRAGYPNDRRRFRRRSSCAGCATCVTTASMPAPSARRSPAAARSTSRPNRFGWAISAPPRPAPYCWSTPARPGRSSPPRHWRRSGS
jgi:hypothetical protein